MKEIPKKVYKYREWTNPFHKKILTENQIYLPSPKDFNDPFDCRIPKNFHLLDTEEKIREYIDISIDKFVNVLHYSREVLEQKKEEVVARIKNNIDKEQLDYEKGHFKKQDKFYGIFSLSTIWNSILMWGHYSENHKGFCVGFWEKKLRNSGKFGKGGMVRYSINFPQIDPRVEDFIEFSYKQTHTKAKDWKYEKEYRLQKIFYPEPATKEDRITKISDSCYSEIILGLNFPENDIQEILNLDKNIPIYRIEKVPFKFKLKRIRIN